MVTPSKLNGISSQTGYEPFARSAADWANRVRLLRARRVLAPGAKAAAEPTGIELALTSVTPLYSATWEALLEALSCRATAWEYSPDHPTTPYTFCS